MAEPSIDERISRIESRNAKATSDKAWETSLTRRGAISGITYIFAGFSLYLLGSNAPWFYALIPVLGYVLSTLSLPLLRALWQTHVYNKVYRKND